jgi:hydrogenase maturation protease
VLVVGIGSTDRGDDGVGPAVARQVAALALPGVRVLPDAQPLDLLDDGPVADLLVVVDAVRSSRPPGTVLVRELGHELLPEWTKAGSTHALGLDAAVELARALGRMPRRLVLVGVEATAEGFATGSAMSPEVSAAVPAAANAVAGVVGTVSGGER